MSMGALERLVAREARGNPRPPGGGPYGPLRRVRDQRGVEVLALPAGFSYVTFSHTGSRMSDGNPTPLALDGMGSFAGGRRHGHGHGHGTGTAISSCAWSATARTATRRAPIGGLLGDRSKAYDPTRVRRHDDARLRRAAAPAGPGLRQPQRHDDQLRGRDLLPPSLLVDRRGDRRRTGRGRSRRALHEAPRLSVPDPGRPRAGGARGRRPDHGRGPLLARGGGGRPADGHRLRDRGPGLRRRRGLLPLYAAQSRPPRRRRRARDARDRRPAER